MAEEAVNTAAKTGELPVKKCLTKTLHIHGYTLNPTSEDLAVYGSDAAGIVQLATRKPELQQQLLAPYPATAAAVIWAVQYELARTVEDVLARRLRLLFLDADAAIAAAPRVAQLLREALGRDAAWEQQQVAQFTHLALHYKIHITDPQASFKPLPTN
jgi:glycerol-3-phosphate dehydrogenase